MTRAEMFQKFIEALAIEGRDLISDRYERITSAINKKFRDTESKTANSLQVGSYGRNTGIQGISDLDMIYIMPKTEWDRYKGDGQSRVLQAVKAAIDTTYPSTQTRVDRLVVVVTFQNYQIEVQPCFEQDDGSFLYPDTYRKEWLNTDPRSEMTAVAGLDVRKNGNLKDLCKMARAWRNKHGQQMGGLLIDTLAYQFLDGTKTYDQTSYGDHHQMVTDFFAFLANEPKEKDHYRAPGSGQRVKIKKRFQRQARKAYKLCLEAIEAQGQKNCNEKWRKVFGRPFPAAPVTEARELAAAAAPWANTEQFIEDKYPVDIRYDLEIDCTVSQDGFRAELLRQLLDRLVPLRPKKRLEFHVVHCNVPQPFELKWKVLNRGEEARRRNEIRGQILNDEGRQRRIENTKFRGEHIVECYAIKNGVVVAKDRIDVPIKPDQA